MSKTSRRNIRGSRRFQFNTLVFAQAELLRLVLRTQPRSSPHSFNRPPLKTPRRKRLPLFRAADSAGNAGARSQVLAQIARTSANVVRMQKGGV